MADVKLGGLSRHNMAMEVEGTWWAVARKNATWNGSTHVENDMGDGGNSRCDWGNHTQDGSVPTGLQIAGSAPKEEKSGGCAHGAVHKEKKTGVMVAIDAVTKENSHKQLRSEGISSAPKGKTTWQATTEITRRPWNR